MPGAAQEAGREGRVGPGGTGHGGGAPPPQRSGPLDVAHAVKRNLMRAADVAGRPLTRLVHADQLDDLMLEAGDEPIAIPRFGL